jgi:hypothetical protein
MSCGVALSLRQVYPIQYLRPPTGTDYCRICDSPRSHSHSFAGRGVTAVCSARAQAQPAPLSHAAGPVGRLGLSPLVIRWSHPTVSAARQAHATSPPRGRQVASRASSRPHVTPREISRTDTASQYSSTTRPALPAHLAGAGRRGRRRHGE